MSKNMMNSSHKATNKNYRDNYTKVFGNNETKGKDNEYKKK